MKWMVVQEPLINPRVLKQKSFATLAFEGKTKAGRRGRQPMLLPTMLRIYFMQQWYALSDPAMEDALYEIKSMRRFAQLDLADDAMPDETTILKFRHLLEKHRLTAAMMNVINDVLEARGLLLTGGTMVDATIIHAPPSTKNRERQRDPEMRQTKKGNQWYFGMKIPVSADVHTGVAHTVAVTAANVADVRPLPNRMREDDRNQRRDKSEGKSDINAGRGRKNADVDCK